VPGFISPGISIQSLFGCKIYPPSSQAIYLLRGLFDTNFLILCAGFILFISSQVFADQAEIPNVIHSTDRSLQYELEQSLKRLGLLDAARDKQLAVALLDITDLKHPRLASVNGNMMMYSASLPKITILLGAFQRIEDGTLKFNK